MAEGGIHHRSLPATTRLHARTERLDAEVRLGSEELGGTGPQCCSLNLDPKMQPCETGFGVCSHTVFWPRFTRVKRVQLRADYSSQYACSDGAYFLRADCENAPRKINNEHALCEHTPRPVSETCCLVIYSSLV